ncbi:hypothetical protein QE152_g26697 [Popillia japonica]|uniref:Uncharacterized protein n=1 Tax=Popillia japonica TaxID=7064 RepID=A0AAW1JXK9_POPJA
MNDDDNNELSDDDIVSAIRIQKIFKTNMRMKMTTTTESLQKISHSDGFNAIKTAILQLEREEDTSPGDILVLRSLQNTVAKKRQTLMSLKSITNFFK